MKTFRHLVVVFCALAAAVVTAVVRGDDPPKPRLAPTPPMGWNSWEAFRRDFDEDVIKAQADAMVGTGLRDAGYTYLVIDGGWKPDCRDKDGNLIEDPKKFPHGMKAVADYVHSKGLKFGLHQPAGMHDCPKLSPGSQGFEERDAALFGKWGLDFVKYDRCDYVHAPDRTPPAPDFDRFVIRLGEKVIFETEAEAVQNRLSGLAQIERRIPCSGDRCVSGIGYDNGAVTVPDVTVAEAGHYKLDVYFAYPYYGQNFEAFKSMTFFVTVNDASPQRVDLKFDNAHRARIGLTTLEVTLKAGSNSIRFDDPLSKEEDIHQSYKKMAAGLNRTGRPIVLSLSGAPRPWLWAEPIAHLYRCEHDITDRWDESPGSIMWVLDRHVELLDYSAVESWPDPDMLEVGTKGRIDQPNKKGPHLTEAQYQAQFSIWCMMNAPLFISMDLRKLDEASKKILLNRDVLAIDQDPLGSPCRCVRSVGDVMVFAKPLTDGVAVAFLNRSDTASKSQLTLADLGWNNQPVVARNLWTGATSHLADGVIAADVDGHSAAILRLQREPAASH